MKLGHGDHSGLNSGSHSAVKQCLKITCGILALLLLATPAVAELRPDIANCEELKDADTQAQIELCTAHAGCNLIMGSKKSCVAAKAFLDNLKAAVGKGTKTFFGYSKEVTSNHVFEASLSDAAKKVEQLPEVRKVLEGTWAVAGATGTTAQSTRATEPDILGGSGAGRSLQPRSSARSESRGGLAAA